MRKYFLFTLIILIVATVFFSGFFINKKNLSSAVYFLAKSFKADIEKENIFLRTENENLKAQIQKNQYFNRKEFQNNGFLSAEVFSTYPLNVKNFLIINKGESDGVEAGAPVMAGNSIFLGVVLSVSKDFSTVRTIFDPGWQIPVKIGENKINGLFTGGNEPKIDLIEKAVRVGDPVFLAMKGLPVGLKIGDIGEIKESGNGIFKEAVIRVFYSISELENVNLTRK